MKKIINKIFFTLLLFIPLLTVKADSYQVSNFQVNNSSAPYWGFIPSNGTREVTLDLVVPDSTYTSYPYLNITVSSSYLNKVTVDSPNTPVINIPVYVVTSNDNSEDKTYIVQVPLNTNFTWNCSTQGMNCYWDGNAKFTFYNPMGWNIPLGILNAYLTTEPINAQNSTIIDQNNTQIETSKNIFERVKDIVSYLNPASDNFFAKKLVEFIVNGLKDLFIPKNFDFINNFKESLENKLGFIASVPLQFLDYILSLPSKVFTPVSSITFPSIEVFGVTFWNDIEINPSSGLGWISQWKYYTDFGCVILCCIGLFKHYNKFGGGS